MNITKLLESSKLHLTHMEDCFLKGPAALDRMMGFYNYVFGTLEGSYTGNNPPISQKIDGGPVISVWTSFPGMPGPGCAGKGLFNKTPIYYTSHDQIDAEDKPEGYKVKLHHVLDFAMEKTIPPGQIWTGDMLFSQGDAQTYEKDGEKFVYVKPVTIVYAAPANSEIARKFLSCKLGAVFHTRYKGSLQNKTNDVSVSEMTHCPEWAFIKDAQLKDLSGKVSFNKKESDYIKKEIDQLKSLATQVANNSEYENLVKNESFVDFYIMSLQNHKVDEQTEINSEEFVNELHDWIDSKMEKERATIPNLKTEAGRQKKSEKIDLDTKELHLIATHYSDLIKNIAQGLALATEIKNYFIDKINQADEWISQVEMPDGFHDTKGEGFIASDIEGNFVKLVDRSAFSFFARNPDVIKGGAHSASRLKESTEFDDDIILQIDEAFGDLVGQMINHDPGQLLESTKYLAKSIIDLSDHCLYVKNLIVKFREKVNNNEPFDLNSGKVISNDIKRYNMDVMQILSDIFNSEYYDEDDKKIAHKNAQMYEYLVNMYIHEVNQYNIDNSTKRMAIPKSPTIKKSKKYEISEDEIVNSIEKLHERLIESLANSNTAVVIFGRMNPISIGHIKLANAIKQQAEKHSGTPFVYLSHSYDGIDSPKFKKGKVKNPLKYEDKIRFVRNAIGDIVEVVESEANKTFEVYGDLYQKGFKNLLIVAGADRAQKFYDEANGHNGKEDPEPKRYFNFDSIGIVDAGARNEDSDDPEEQASASLLRACVEADDYDKFESFAGTKSETRTMFEVLQQEMGLTQKPLKEATGGDYLEGNHSDEIDIEVNNHPVETLDDVPEDLDVGDIEMLVQDAYDEVHEDDYSAFDQEEEGEFDQVSPIPLIEQERLFRRIFEAAQKVIQTGKSPEGIKAAMTNLFNKYTNIKWYRVEKQPGKGKKAYIYYSTANKKPNGNWIGLDGGEKKVKIQSQQQGSQQGQNTPSIGTGSTKFDSLIHGIQDALKGLKDFQFEYGIKNDNTIVICVHKETGVRPEGYLSRYKEISKLDRGEAGKGENKHGLGLIKELIKAKFNNKFDSSSTAEKMIGIFTMDDGSKIKFMETDAIVNRRANATANTEIQEALVGIYMERHLRGLSGILPIEKLNEILTTKITQEQYKLFIGPEWAESIKSMSMAVSKIPELYKVQPENIEKYFYNSIIVGHPNKSKYLDKDGTYKDVPDSIKNYCDNLVAPKKHLDRYKDTTNPSDVTLFIGKNPGEIAQQFMEGYNNIIQTVRGYIDFSNGYLYNGEIIGVSLKKSKNAVARTNAGQVGTAKVNSGRSDIFNNTTCLFYTIENKTMDKVEDFSKWTINRVELIDGANEGCRVVFKGKNIGQDFHTNEPDDSIDVSVRGAKPGSPLLIQKFEGKLNSDGNAQLGNGIEPIREVFPGFNPGRDTIVSQKDIIQLKTDLSTIVGFGENLNYNKGAIKYCIDLFKRAASQHSPSKSINSEKNNFLYNMSKVVALMSKLKLLNKNTKVNEIDTDVYNCDYIKISS